MFGIKRRIRRRQIGDKAIQQLRGLGLSEVEAVDVVRKVHELYEDTRFTSPTDVVQATPAFYAAGLNWADLRRALHAAAALAHVTGSDYEYMAQILIRMAAQGRITMQEVRMLRGRGVPLWVIRNSGQEIACDTCESQFLAAVRAGQFTYEGIISAVLDSTDGLEI